MTTEEQRIVECALAFPMDAILLRYRRELRVPPRIARQHERELKRFLALSALRDVPYVMYGPVDRLWHTFLLFTRDYAAFCQRLGRFIHHIPQEPAEMRLEASRDNYARFRRDYEALFGEAPPAQSWPEPDAPKSLDAVP